MTDARMAVAPEAMSACNFDVSSSDHLRRSIFLAIQKNITP
jgi:hypothetical protein